MKAGEPHGPVPMAGDVPSVLRIEARLMISGAALGLGVDAMELGLGVDAMEPGLGPGRLDGRLKRLPRVVSASPFVDPKREKPGA